MAETVIHRVRAPNGKVYPVRGPKNATPQQLSAAILKAYPEAKGTGRVPKTGAVGKVETAGMGLTRGLDEALFGTVRLIGKGFEYLGAEDTGRAMQRYAKGELDKSTAAYEPFLRANPMTAEGGRIGGNILGLVAPGKAVAAPLKVLAKVAPRVAPAVTALTSGGMATGITTVKDAPVIAKAIDAALRIGGGATAGAASSAVLDQSIEEGTAVGAAVSMIPLIGRYGIAPVWDTLRGRVGDARAARIFRQALGASSDAARQAFLKGGKGTASQILARLGVDADQFFATGQVVARQGATKGTLDDIARDQQIAQQQTLAAAAGGTSRTASRDAAAAQRRGTTATATPIMQEALGTVNVNTRTAAGLQREADLARGVASEESRTAARLLKASDRNADLIKESGLRLPADIKRQREIVSGLESRGEAAGLRSVEAGAAARSAEQRLAELRGAGVQPLDAGSLSARFRALAAKESANPERASIFTGFADEVDRLAAENNGILDAFDLYEIRKDAGGFVDRLLTGRRSPEAIRKRTAEVVSAARPLIDDTIEAAGGKRWREYLDTFSTGMDEAKRIEIADYARNLYEKSPEAFEQLMAGNRPEIVERFFGKGRYDINEVLGPKSVNPQGPARHGQILTATPQGPSRLPAMQGVAQDVAADVKIANAMKPGAVARAEDALSPPPNVMVRLGQALPFQLGGVIEQPARMFDQYKNRAVTQALEKGYSSPENALSLMDYIPSGQRLFINMDQLSPEVLRTLQQFGVQIGREEPNYMMQIRR